MRVLFLGDIVGRPGREVVTKRLPKLIEKWKLDFVAINGENSAGGFGITEARAETDTASELSGQGTRTGCGTIRCQERQARSRHQCDGPRLHGST